MNSYPCGDYSYSLLEGGTARRDRRQSWSSRLSWTGVR